MSARRPICLNTFALLNQAFRLCALCLTCSLSDLPYAYVTSHHWTVQNRVMCLKDFQDFLTHTLCQQLGVP